MTVAATLLFGKRTAESGRYDEHPANSNITEAWDDYSKITGAPAYQRQPWCGAADVDGLAAGGWVPPPNWIGVYAIQAWGEAHKRWHRGPTGVQAGDTLVLFGPGVHTGIARSGVRRDGTILTQEGNTSPGATGSQWNGGTYALRVRPASDVYGWTQTHDLLGGGKKIKPHPVDTKPADPQYRRESKRGALRLWEQGPRVETLQQQLGLPADGYFGRDTARAVGHFKAEHGQLGDDATVVGAKMLAELEKLTRPAPRFRTLRRGDKGGHVRKLQRLLIRGGYLPERTDGWRNDDGDFGPVTARAVRKVEKNIGRPQNGTAGTAVWKALTS